MKFQKLITGCLAGLGLLFIFSGSVNAWETVSYPRPSVYISNINYSYSFGQTINPIVTNKTSSSIYYYDGCASPFLMIDTSGQIVYPNGVICTGFYISRLDPGQSFQRNIDSSYYKKGYFRLKFIYAPNPDSETYDKYTYSSYFRIY